ncbi:MAG: ribosomal RNA small subunit methyltransferase A [Nitrospiraceae bacterium]|nr:MAG: ribosomal RNA small subunit methyltransferase A [Nitrospiraceae bacterium]
MKRPFGQHFLFDPNILKKIIACSGVTKEDTVVEIGPGLGTLTKFLSFYAKKIIAIEIDRRLIEKLEGILAPCSNVELIQADAMKFPYDTIEGNFRVVANIPYYITTPLLFRLLEFKEKVTGMTLLMQKEVAKRITASHGSKDYGVLSISAQYHTKPELKFMVSRRAFVPPPEVDSAVVHFDVSHLPLFPVVDERLFFDIVKAAFSQRRKTVLNSLKKFEGIGHALSASGIDPKQRPEKLSIEDFTRLANALK